MRMRREFMKIVSVALCSLIVAAFFILNIQFSRKKNVIPFPLSKAQVIRDSSLV
jgi:hypothetical protein